MEKYEEFDKKFKFGVSGKMLSLMLPSEFPTLEIKETDSLLLDEFILYLKKGERTDEEVESIIQGFDNNQAGMEEWEAETLNEERQKRMFWRNGGKEGDGRSQKTLVEKIKDLENQRIFFNFDLPFA